MLERSWDDFDVGLSVDSGICKVRPLWVQRDCYLCMDYVINFIIKYLSALCITTHIKCKLLSVNCFVTHAIKRLRNLLNLLLSANRQNFVTVTISFSNTFFFKIQPFLILLMGCNNHNRKLGFICDELELRIYVYHIHKKV